MFTQPAQYPRIRGVFVRLPTQIIQNRPGFISVAYWTLDSSGASRLRAEDARTLGFPIIHNETMKYRFSWDKTVYDELFDPDTEDTAKHLGYPLFEVSRDAGTLLACSEHNLHNRRLLYSSKVCVSKGEIDGYDCDLQLEDVEFCQEFSRYIKTQA
jgi:hypothetical protein